MDRSDSTENPCPVCHDTIQFFAIGPCDHPVCYKCSTRMRVLCEQMDCPICRSTMPQVAFVYDKKLFKDINLRDCIPNRKNKIFYESEEIEDGYLDLLEFRCRLCPQRKPERTFAQLQTHMRRDHHLFACDICLIHLKIFPFETKFYDRKSLAVHRRVGDEDDKSYKGHPLCEFCDTRYLDKDELMKHLRKDHYYCHFCDQEGSNAYYNEYADLLEHFKGSHYLCTEDECGNPSTRFTHAFSSEIDLKSHKASVHNNKSKETRTIDIDFQFAPRHQGHGRGNSRVSDDGYEDSSSHRHRNRGERYGNQRRRQHHDDPDLQQALEASLEDANEAKARPPVKERVPDPIHDFPTLSGAPATQTQTVVDSPKPNISFKKVDDFPTLGASNGNGKKPQNPVKNYAAATHYATESHPQVKEKVKESKPVSLGSVKGKTNSHRVTQAPAVTEDDYPSLLGRSKPPTRPVSASAVNSSSTWLQKFSVTEVPTASSISSSLSIVTDRPDVQECQPVKRSVPVMRPISDEKEFPSLGGGGVQKPELVPTNTSWSKQKPSSSRKPKSMKVDDESFELPESYFRSYESSEHHVKEKAKVDSSSSNGSKKSITVNKKDFPGLPTRKAENKPPDKDKGNSRKQAENENKKESKSSEKSLDAVGSGKKSKKSKKGSIEKSLNDIAAGLMNVSTTTSQETRSKKGKTDENANNSKHNKNSSEPKSVKTEASKNSDFSAKKQRDLESEKDTGFKIDNSFPSLHAMSPSVQRINTPPGFMPNQLNLQPDAPPGFSKPAAPPGLSKPTFSAHDYIQPANFSSRNQLLVQNVRSCLETVKDGFDNFKTLSFQFRQGVTNANLYYTNCQLLIGEVDFGKIFPELLALLPDINKQQELWFQHQVALVERSGSNSTKNFKSMSPCNKCGQIVLKEDMQHHNLQHGDGKDFPSLRDSSLNNGNQTSGYNLSGVSNAWIKAT